MMEINWTLTRKQAEAFRHLQDEVTEEIFYGGAAGGGKTFLGCAWLIVSCLKYQGTRYLMGRAVLKNLKSSTLLTLFSICKLWGFKKDQHYRYNAMEGVITFYNGSQIYLKDLFQYPSDPEFDSLGSTEYTYAFIDEASQINMKAYNIVRSRLRYGHKEFGIKPKILVCSNPSKNFLYSRFYKPHKDGELPESMAFIKALIQDNPYLPETYATTLQSLDKVSKERLLYGNFEYDDDPSALIDFNMMIEMFHKGNIHKKGMRHMTVDVARYGSDKTVVVVWFGLRVAQIRTYSKTSTKEVVSIIKSTARTHNVKFENIVIDEDGVGGGVVDHLEGVQGFVNNSKPFDNEDNDLKYNYSNLKSQCYFTLADYINRGRIIIYEEHIDPNVKEMLIEELEQVKAYNIDKDSKLQILPKDKVKEHIGRSPDISDALMMRMYFEVKPKDHFLFFEG